MGFDIAKCMVKEPVSEVELKAIIYPVRIETDIIGSTPDYSGFRYKRKLIVMIGDEIIELNEHNAYDQIWDAAHRMV